MQLNTRHSRIGDWNFWYIKRVCEISVMLKQPFPAAQSRGWKAQWKRINIFWHGCIAGCTRWFYCALYFNYNCAVAICSISFPNYRCKKHFTTPTHKNKKIWGISWQACSECLPFFLGLWTLPPTVHLNRPERCLCSTVHFIRSGCLSLSLPLVISFYCYYVLFAQVFVCHANMWLPVHMSFSVSTLLPLKII